MDAILAKVCGHKHWTPQRCYFINLTPKRSRLEHWTPQRGCFCILGLHQHAALKAVAIKTGLNTTVSYIALNALTLKSRSLLIAHEPAVTIAKLTCTANSASVFSPAPVASHSCCSSEYFKLSLATQSGVVTDVVTVACSHSRKVPL